jgi:hypothetical protein
MKEVIKYVIKHPLNDLRGSTKHGWNIVKHVIKYPYYVWKKKSTLDKKTSKQANNTKFHNLNV